MPIGNHFNCTENTNKNISPIQNVGTLACKYENNFITLSNIFPRLNAAKVPKTKPITPDKIHDIPIRATEAPTLSLIISITGFLYIKDVPKFPVIKFLSHIKYCVIIGLSNP